jgi:multicomponent Na+:H+ antiporter subunit F
LTEIALTIAAALILLGIVFAMIRLAIGPNSVDRIAALDLLGIITISLIALYAHLADRFIYLDVALVYGLLSFLAVLAIARHLERGR